jgi:hypothetical protein
MKSPENQYENLENAGIGVAAAAASVANDYYYPSNRNINKNINRLVGSLNE